MGRPGQVVAFGDVDNDGDLDVYTGYNAGNASTETSELMINNGDGTFLWVTRAMSFATATQPSRRARPLWTTIVMGDWIWLGQASATQDRLFWGYGDGTFVDVTNGVNLQTRDWSGNVLDAINNGAAHTVSWSQRPVISTMMAGQNLSSSYGRSPNHLWQGNAEGMFENRSVASGYAFDDNQDWSDNESARCWCSLHPTAADCEGVPAPELIACNEDDDAFRWSHGSDRQPYRLGGNSGATICADINNDGWNDLLTTEIVHWDVGGSSIQLHLQQPNGCGLFFDRHWKRSV